MRPGVVAGLLCSLRIAASQGTECESVADPDQGLNHNWCECVNGSCFQLNKEFNCKPLGAMIDCPTPTSSTPRPTTTSTSTSSTSTSYATPVVVW
ncbi:uncharacterized protein PG986_004812 [Apiospora aurea]|uniref:Secreted protein n=1 Tax=Apiospora aurea TaxID=335848 RepID=A0ABR1QNM8_9PEZI